ncbi:MAG: hypothetical protein HPAVJP_3240 [Candidatus Hepatoplasma vulgare]|nr:MAG: hypothetical protein HPAVJP_3240 [Candidatus Hepatoplasma sp.]
MKSKNIDQKENNKNNNLNKSIYYKNLINKKAKIQDTKNKKENLIFNPMDFELNKNVLNYDSLTLSANNILDAKLDKTLKNTDLNRSGFFTYGSDASPLIAAKDESTNKNIRLNVSLSGISAITFENRVNSPFIATEDSHVITSYKLNTDFEPIKEGTFDYPQLTLNGESISTWPSGSGASSASQIRDDNDTNPTNGINPWKTQIDENADDISGIIDGTIPINVFSSTATDDSEENPTEGINPWKTAIDKNVDDILGIIDGTIPTNSVSSSTEDDSEENPTFGINPWKTAIDTNTDDIANITRGDFNYPKLTLSGDTITEWPSGDGASTSSGIADDNEENPTEGINPWKTAIDTNTDDIADITSGNLEFTSITLNGETIDTWPSGEGASTSSGIADDSGANPTNGINPWKTQIDTNLNNITGIMDGTITTNSVSSSTEDDSISNPTFGINPWKTAIDTNTDDIADITSGNLEFTSITLNGETIETWPSGGEGGASLTSDITAVNSTLEGGENQQLINQTNKVNITTNTSNIASNTSNISDIISGDIAFTEITLNGETITSWPSDGEGGASSTSDITAVSSTLEGGNTQQIINEANKINIETNASNIEDITSGIIDYPQLILDGETITSWPSGGSGGTSSTSDIIAVSSTLEGGANQQIINEANKINIETNASNIADITSGDLEFTSITLNGETIDTWPSGGSGGTSSTSDLLAVDSALEGGENQQSINESNKESIDTNTSNIASNTSNIASNTSNISSITSGEFVFTEINLNGETIDTWPSGANGASTSDIIAVSSISEGGANQQIINEANKVSINKNAEDIAEIKSGLNSYPQLILNEQPISNWPSAFSTSDIIPVSSALEGGANQQIINLLNKENIESNTSDMEDIRSGELGFTEITLNGESISTWPSGGSGASSTSDLLAVDSALEGGANQQLINEVNKESIDTNTSDIADIISGDLPFTSINLNGETIDTWPSGDGASASSGITDDSETNPTEGINPWKTTIDENASDIAKIIDGTILTNSVSSSTEDDSISNPTFGINPWKTAIDENASDIADITSGNLEFTSINLNGETIDTWPSGDGASASSGITDDSETNPTEGINPWKTAIDENASDILENKSDISDITSGDIEFTSITLNGETINTWPSGDGASASSGITDDSETNPTEGINPWKTAIDENASDISDITSGDLEFTSITLNGETITTWPSDGEGGASSTSDVTAVSSTLEGGNTQQIINEANKINIDKNASEISDIESGLIDYPQLILDGETITSWPSGGSGGASSTSDVTAVSSTLEGGANQQIINEANKENIETNTSDIADLVSGDLPFTSINLNGDTIDSWPSGDGASASSGITDDSETNPTEGINPWKTAIDENASDILENKSDISDITSGDLEFTSITLNGETITTWPSDGEGGASSTSDVTAVSSTLEGGNTQQIINEANKINIDKNASEISDIESGLIDYPQLILDGETITSWPSGGSGGASSTSDVTAVSSTLEGGANQQIINESNKENIETNTSDIADLVSGDLPFTSINLNGDTIDSWPSGGSESSLTSDILAVNFISEGGSNQQVINEVNKSNIGTNTSDIAENASNIADNASDIADLISGDLPFTSITLNGDTITEWPSGGEENYLTSDITAVSSTLEGGINQQIINELNKSNIATNTSDIATNTSNIADNASDIADLIGGDLPFTSITLNGDTITEWPSGGEENYSTSDITAVSSTLEGGSTQQIINELNKETISANSSEINKNSSDIADLIGGDLPFTSITLNGDTITEWPSDGGENSLTSNIDAVSSAAEGGRTQQIINEANKVNVDKNASDILDIKSGIISYPQLILNGNTITEWPSVGEEDYSTSDITAVSSTLEGGSNQQIINELNKSNIATNTSDIATNTSNIADNASDIADLIGGDLPFTSITLNGDTITEWPSDGSGETLYTSDVLASSSASEGGSNQEIINRANKSDIESIQDGNINFPKLTLGGDTITEWPSDGSGGTLYTSDILASSSTSEGGSDQEAINRANKTSIEDNTSDISQNTSDIGDIQDGNINFPKLTLGGDTITEWPSDGSGGTLYTSDILASSSTSEGGNNQEIINRANKSDIESIQDGNINFPKLTLGGDTITEWPSGGSGGTLYTSDILATSSSSEGGSDQEAINRANKTSIEDNTSDIGDIQGGNIDFPKLTLGGDTITEWPSGGSGGTLYTSDILATSSSSEGGSDQEAINRANKTSIEDNTSDISQNTSDIGDIQEGNIDFPKLTLGGDTITEWPSGGSGGTLYTSDILATSSASEGGSDQEAINKANKTSIEDNTSDIGDIQDGNIDFPKLTLGGDTITEWPSGGSGGTLYTSDILATSSTAEGGGDQEAINRANKSDIEDIQGGNIDFPKLTLGGDTITEWPSGDGVSASSDITDDSETNPTEGINPWKTTIDENTDDINSIETGDFDFPQLSLNGEIITSWPSGDGASASSDITDDSEANPTEGINPWKTAIDANADDIADIIDGTITINLNSSGITDDSETNPTEGINPWKTTIDENTDDINSIETGDFDFPQLSLNGEIITSWPSGDGASASSDITDDSETNPTEGINPWKTAIDANADDIADIIDGTITINLNSSGITDDSETNPTEGINPWKTTIDENTDDINSIETGDFDFPQLSLNGEIITSWPSGDGASASSDITDDSETNPDDGINPWKTTIDANADDIADIIDGTITINLNSSGITDDSETNPTEGINPWKTTIDENTDDINSIETGDFDFPQLSLNGEIITSWPSGDGASASSDITDDSETNPDDGINPWKTTIDENTDDINSIETGDFDFPQLSLNGEIITSWPSGDGASASSDITDDSETNPDDGINPWKTTIDANTDDINSIETGDFDFPQLSLNGEIITSWPSGDGASASSEITDDSETNPDDGINPWKTTIDANTDDINSIETGDFDFPQLSLNGEIITSWPSGDGASASSGITDDSETNPTEGINPKLLEIENKLDDYFLDEELNQEAEFGYTENGSPFIRKTDLTTSEDAELRILTDSINLIHSNGDVLLPISDSSAVPKLYVDNLLGDISAEVSQNTDDINSIETGDFDFPQLSLNGEIITSWPSGDGASASSEITDDSETNPDDGINPWKTAIDENTDDINSIETGDFDFPQLSLNGEIITSWPSGDGASASSDITDDSETNPTEGINPKLLEIENKLDDYFLDEELNQEAEFGYTENGSPFIRKTDLTTSEDAELRILTDSINLIHSNGDVLLPISDSSAVPKLYVDNLLGDISAEVSQNTDDINSIETGDFDFPQLSLNGEIITSWPSGDGASASSGITDDSETNPDDGINPWKTTIDENTDDINSIETGDFDFPQLSLNGEIITSWPSGDGASASSGITDDSETNPTEGINPKLLEIENKLDDYFLDEELNQEAEFGYTENGSPFIRKTDLTTSEDAELRILTDSINLIHSNGDVLLPISDSSAVPKLYVDNLLGDISAEVSQNTDDINSIETGDFDFPQLSLNGEIITSWPSGDGASASSEITDDSETNPDDGINPWKTAIDENTDDINSIETGDFDFPQLSLNGEIITSWPSGDGASASSDITDDSETNPTEGINPKLLEIENKLDDYFLDEELNQEAEFGYTENGSPFIRKTDLTTSEDAELRILTDSINLIHSNGDVLLPISDSSAVPKLYVDNLLGDISAEVSQNTDDINSIETGDFDFPQLSLNGEIITSWPSGDGASASSGITDDSETNPTEGINPWKTAIDENTDDINSIETGDFDFPQLSLNGEIITSWPSGDGASASSGITDDSETNPTEGINPWKNQIDENTDDIADIIDGTISVTSRSSLTTDDSSTNPLQGINPWKTAIDINTDDIAGMLSGDVAFDSINLNGNSITSWPSGDGASASSGITDDSETNPTEGINPWKTAIDENTDDINSIETGDFDFPQISLNGEIITSWPSGDGASASSGITDDSETNPEEGINPKLLEIEDKLDDYFLDEELNQEAEFGYAEDGSPFIRKTDLTTSEDAELRILADSINLIHSNGDVLLPISDSSAVPKLYVDDALDDLSAEVSQNTEDLDSIKTGDFDFSQITLAGESITAWPSGGASSSSLLTDDSEENPDDGINPWKTQIDENVIAIAANSADIADIIDGTISVTSRSSLTTDDSSTNPLQGINPWKTQIDENAIGITENAAEIASIEDGTFNYSKLTLAGESITAWPSGGASSSSLLTDDSEENPDDGINPWKIQIDENVIAIAANASSIAANSADIEDLIDGTTSVNSISSLTTDDSATNPLQGINPWKTQIDENAIGITENAANIAGIIDGTTSITLITNTSELIDDSETNSTEGINSWKTQIDANVIAIAANASSIAANSADIEDLIDGTTSVNSISSLTTDDSATNPLQGINPWKTQIDENAIGITENAANIAGIIDGTTSITLITNTSELIDDSETNSTEGINSWKSEIDANAVAISNNTENIEDIIDGTIQINSSSSLTIDNSATNPLQGINPWKTQIDENTSNIAELMNATNFLSTTSNTSNILSMNKIIKDGETQELINENVQDQINNLNEIIKKLYLPIDSIIISSDSPQYGIWINMGKLSENKTFDFSKYLLKNKENKFYIWKREA